MFGFAPFAEAPFSALPLGSLWIEQRPSIDTWTQVDPTEISFLTKDSSGTEYQASLIVLSSTAVRYTVNRQVANSSGTMFVAVTNLWQDSSTSSNSWVEV